MTISLQNIKALGGTIRRQLCPSGIFLCVMCAWLVLNQGGFFGLAANSCGLIICAGAMVCLIFHAVKVLHKKEQVHAWPVVSLLFLVVAVLYAVSTLINQTTLTSFSETGTWAAVAAASFMAWTQTEEHRRGTLNLLSLIGVLAVILAALIQTGLLDIFGGIANHRLYFTFQYPNVTALWFCLIGMLWFYSEIPFLRRFTPLAFAVAACTLSGGMAFVFLVMLVLLCVGAFRSGEFTQIWELMLFSLAGILIFAALRIATGPIGILCFCLGAVICGFLPRALRPLLQWNRKKLALMLIICTAIIVAVVLGILFSSRLLAALKNFGTRLDYAADALTLIGAHPLFGIGPDQWQFIYPRMQTSQYIASVVHCSYLQIALDAGIPALLSFIGAATVGIKQLWPTRHDQPMNFAALTAVFLVLAHALVDFDLQFCSIALLFAYLITKPAFDEHTKVSTPNISDTAQKMRAQRTAHLPGLLASICAVAGCTVLSFLGWGAALYLNSLDSAADSGDFTRAQSLFYSSSVAYKDSSAQESYLRCAYVSENYEAVADYCTTVGISTGNQALYAYRSLWSFGQKDLATSVVLDEFEKEPLNRTLYWSIKKMFDEVGATKAGIARFNALVDSANTRSQELMNRPWQTPALLYHYDA